jgi:hypothetical protein
MRRLRRNITFRQALEMVALGLAIVVAAILAFGNSVGSARPLAGKAGPSRHAVAGAAATRLP